MVSPISIPGFPCTLADPLLLATLPWSPVLTWEAMVDLASELLEPHPSQLVNHCAQAPGRIVVASQPSIFLLPTPPTPFRSHPTLNPFSRPPNPSSLLSPRLTPIHLPLTQTTQQPDKPISSPRFELSLFLSPISQFLSHLQARNRGCAMCF
ncbi:hypothetical protein C1H46_027525 [Malus baccata]|uniref:Uncharacterized protein n=1 Tax=Malus baccata TaxID=106549 RepID=A0A540LKB2_MALBA|nr:hypothetical protein C1H46_027525 [Malus baccata]